MTVRALLLIDSNKYLDLYRTDKGRKLLAPLSEQARYIFVTEQIVKEVQRNKIAVAAEFLRRKSHGLKLEAFNVPDHLSGAVDGKADEILKYMRAIQAQVDKVNQMVDDLVIEIMGRVSKSRDEVSMALAPIFANAISASPEEMERARRRRDFGHPPGKSGGPIGDQLSWEQILTHFQGKSKLWIISRDGDFGTSFGGKGILNGLLYEELRQVAREPEVYLFEDIVEGITHFVDVTGVAAQNRLTDEEIEEIEKEEKSLPPLDSTSDPSRRVVSAGLTREEMARALAAISYPTDEMRKTLAAALAFPTEEMRKTLAAALAFPTEEMRKTLAAALGYRQAREGRADDEEE